MNDDASLTPRQWPAPCGFEVKHTIPASPERTHRRQVPDGDALIAAGGRQMRRYGQTGLRIALLAIAAAAAQACAAPKVSELGPIEVSRLLVVQADNGFVIHTSVPLAVNAAASSPGPISLGDSVRLDRRLLLPSSTKEIPNGETR
ncbi:hypothetical protein [Sphingopyxis chilensis]